MTECDATRVLRASGRPAHCSKDRMEVWHGMSTPAQACGYHGTYYALEVFAGHRLRLGVTS